MDWIPLALALVAIVIALRAAGRASAALAAAEDASREAQRRASTVEEELRCELGVLKRQLAKVAGGATLTAEMIIEGQLWRDIDGDEALTVARDGAFILDVRTQQETMLGVIAGAVLIPIDDIEERKVEIPRDGRAILVYCAIGSRSAAVCEHLAGQGFDDLLNLEGGIAVWTGATEKPSNS